MPMAQLAPSPRARAAIARFRDEPVPALAILHALQAEAGGIEEADLAEVAAFLGMEPAELYGAVTFYGYFTLGRGEPARWSCQGPACRMRRHDGARQPPGRPAPCTGRCETPIAALLPDRSLTPEPSPPVRFSGHEPLLLAHVHHADQPSLAAARGRGAYRAWEAARARPPEAIVAEVAASGLCGRGGAGFPAGAKWHAVRAAAGAPKAVVANADEGEPVTFKDRPILERDPHLLLEGMRIAAHAVGASIGIVYLRYEYPEAEGILNGAVAEARAAGILGPSFDVFVRRGAGAYICGEETSLLESLEGKKPFPREKPPYPTTSGLLGRPTLVQNVETLAAVPRIVESGAPRWKERQPKIYSLAGDVVRPGNYELRLGTTLRELLAAAGGVAGGELGWFTLGGLSGGLLGPSDVDLPLDYAAPRERGAMLGSGGILVGSARRCPVDLARAAAEFFRHESCGKCFPCRIGTERTAARLADLSGGRAGPAAIDELGEIGAAMARTSACGLGQAAPAVVQGLLARFRPTVEAHLAGRCPAGVCGGA